MLLKNKTVFIYGAGVAIGAAGGLLQTRERNDVGRSHFFKELPESGEGIARDILSRRLKKLLAHKIVEVSCGPSDRRRRHYLLTSNGKALAPVLAEMVV